MRTGSFALKTVTALVRRIFSVRTAAAAKIVSGALFTTPTISVADFMVISVIGAIISSIVVLVITVAVAAFCANRDLDLDNVAAPIVTASGDIATLPSLFLARAKESP